MGGDAVRQIPSFYPRLLMFTLMCALTVWVMHYILPGAPDNALGDVTLNPLAQVGLFIVLTLGGGLIAFWITFGDVLRQQEK